jgi:hypothetical protein
VPALETAIGRIADELNEVVEDLRETARGIRPAILFDGGLGPALRTLATPGPHLHLALGIPPADTMAAALSRRRSRGRLLLLMTTCALALPGRYRDGYSTL